MIDAFLMMYQTDCMDCVTQSGQKNSAKIKNRRTEKTVRRCFINMGNTSKTAVKQKR